MKVDRQINQSAIRVFTYIIKVRHFMFYTSIKLVYASHDSKKNIN